MSFSFRDKGRLSDRLRGKTCDEIIKELRDHLHQDRGMSFDSSPSWGGFSSSPAFARAGFPFMDQDMMSGPDMRAHFADLANRHPEFAEHLRPSAWNTAPETDPHFFHSTASGPSTYRQRHSSGGSGSGSFGEGEAIPIPVIHEDSGGGESNSSRSRARKIPQYGMRNTVDLGESQKSTAMDGSEGDSRSQRSWSAPPDNRTQVEAPQPKRFVTKVDVNNGPANPTSGNDSDAHPGSASNTSSPGGKPPPFPKPSGAPQAPQSTSKPGNVRHIPIFVEGRDEPILPKTQERQSFASSHSASGFGQPNSSFSYASATPGSHASAFASSQSPAGSTRSQSSAPHPQASGAFPRPSGPFSHPSAPHPQASGPFTRPSGPFSHPSAPHPQTRGPYPQQSAPQKPKHETPPPQPQPPKPTLPKDPIAKVKAIQEEVNELKKKVESFSGSRSDKEYIYLDEMLTRNLLKLDDIETEGKDSIRQARKEAIRSIEKCISILESKAPLPQEKNGGETESTQMTDAVMDDSSGADALVDVPESVVANGVPLEPMEVQPKLGDEDPNNPTADATELKTDESSQAETPMEVTSDASNRKGEVTTSEPVSKPEELAQNPEMMDVVADGTNENGVQHAASQEHELHQTEVQVNSTESSGMVPGETVSSDSVNTNCDGNTSTADNTMGVNGEAANTVTEVKVDVAAPDSTVQGNAVGAESGVVFESIVKDGDSSGVPAEGVSGEESKVSTTVVSEAVKTSSEASGTDIPPVDIGSKEGSS